MMTQLNMKWSMTTMSRVGDLQLDIEMKEDHARKLLDKAIEDYGIDEVLPKLEEFIKQL